ncbi:MAG: hypothetical protein J6U97_03630 [Bacteroidaceae bacterium]|nr:hypothetical protein [Bacteroidaceae bacterium]
MLKEYLKLLARREAKVVLGGKMSNLWLLTLVLVATFVSIAFSNGSMKYLRDKMDDPFTNWVSIENSYEDNSGIVSFRDDIINDQSLKEQYKFEGVQSESNIALSMYCKDLKRAVVLDVRSYSDLNSALMSAILSEDNVVSNAAVQSENIVYNTLGFIITKDVLVNDLKYSEDELPAYIYYSKYSEGADTLGFEMGHNDKYAPVPLPVLAVVEKLPMNVDMICSHYFYEQFNNPTYPFNLNKKEYAESLSYFVPGEIVDFSEQLKEIAADRIDSYMPVQQYSDNQVDYITSWKEGSIVQVYPNRDRKTIADKAELNKIINNHFAEQGVVRVHRYAVSNYRIDRLRYLSVYFTSLDSIRAFEKFARQNYNVDVEMSQVSSKENFNAVSIMANILSWAMIVFSIVCIIMFIVNMLQSYFQKVKRNLGTFKAFGIGSMELISVYVLIMLAIIITAIVISLSFTWLLQALLPLFGVLKDGEFNYLALWNMKTICSIVIVIVATVVTVYAVMSRLLKQTPGDLIYDR